MISNNISKITEYDDFILYRAECSCILPDHAHTLQLAYEDTGHGEKEISLTLYTKIAYLDTYGVPWYKNVWRRIKICLNLLTGGFPEVNDSFVFNGSKAVEDYIKALQEGLDKLKKFENK